VLREWDRLAAATTTFRDALYGSSLPHAVLDAAAANLSVLKSPTTVRLTDGTFYGFEGCHPTAGSCEGSCTHVWNYQQALPFLYPTLERSMRAADYLHNMDAAGGMSFRLGLPIGAELSTERACADGQFGNVMKLYRDWKLSGDDAWLRRLWPRVKRSIEYAWHPDNPDRWDPERTGVLWGRQHHTLDMELFGPNAWLSGFYLGALEAGAEMAEALGEHDTACEWRGMADRGRRWVDENLFNGAYFVQRIELANRAVLAPYGGASLSRRLMGGDVYDQYWSGEHKQLKYQLGEGCLIDQVVAEWHARIYGIGAIFDPVKVATSLRAIWRHNFTERLGDIYNPCRVFGLDDESGTVVAAWPPDVPKPAVPVPYAQETFHGMEYAFGGALMQHGMLREGVRVFRAVRDRYDGSNRNPWNELECGSNYARSMASWCGVLVLSGFSFDAHRRHIGFDPKLRDGLAFDCFWCNGLAWGTVTLEHGSCTLRVVDGETPLASLGLPIPDGAAVAVTLNRDHVAAEARDGALQLGSLRLRPGDVLRAAAPVSIAQLPDVATL
jgi:non-lysosomal glucosylceramidase